LLNVILVERFISANFRPEEGALRLRRGFQFPLVAPPLTLQRLLGAVAADFEIVFDLLETLYLGSELLLAPSVRPILLVFQCIDLTFQHLFLRVPLLVELVEGGFAPVLESLFTGIRCAAKSEHCEMEST
jgi:hypothetical protein